MGIDKLLKKVVLYFLDAAMILLLLLLAYFMVFTTITASSDKVKQIIGNSGVYSQITPVIYDSYTDSGSSAKATTEGLPLQDQKVGDAANQVFDPEFVRTNIETVVDGVYDWLGGKSAEPSFNVDLSSAKSRFIQQVANQAASRAETLPVCTPAQLRELENTNLLSIPCRTSNADMQALKEDFISSANSNDGFLKDTSISPATLKDENGRSVFEDLKQMPENFQKLKKAPVVIGVLIVLVGTFILMISRSRKEGFNKLAVLLAVGGALVIVFPFGLNIIIDGLLRGGGTDAKLVDNIISPLLHSFMDKASVVYYWLGGIYLALAAISFGIYKKLSGDKPKIPTNEKGSE